MAISLLFLFQVVHFIIIKPMYFHILVNNMTSTFHSLRSNGIGTLREKSLHMALKELYKKSEDKTEVSIDGHIIDVVSGDLLIEIQTQNFSAIRNKLTNLIKRHKVLLVYPIITKKWIVCQDHPNSKEIRRRMSPKHETYEKIFDELISIPHLIPNPNFSIEILLVQVEEIRRNDGKGSWKRKGWSIYNRKLLKVDDKHTYHGPNDFLAHLPKNMKAPFTNYTLASILQKPISLIRKITYCLRKMGVLQVVGKKGRTFLFSF
jgi:hypothetical protein